MMTTSTLGLDYFWTPIMAYFSPPIDRTAARRWRRCQRRFAAYNADASETLSVRIGIDAGEPVTEGSDLFGSTVQLASRLCSEAEANGIMVSGFARELCQEDAVRFVALGERRLKGLPRRLRYYGLSGGTESNIGPGAAAPQPVGAFVAIHTIKAPLASDGQSRRLTSVQSADSRSMEWGSLPQATCVVTLHRVVSNRRFQRSPGLSSSPKT